MNENITVTSIQIKDHVEVDEIQLMNGVKAVNSTIPRWSSYNGRIAQLIHNPYDDKAPLVMKVAFAEISRDGCQTIEKVFIGYGTAWPSPKHKAYYLSHLAVH